MKNKIISRSFRWISQVVSRLPFQVRLPALGIYVFALMIGYLAASYLGDFFIVLSTAFILFPGISLLLLLIASTGLRYSQNFSSKQPVKGEKIQYSCIIENGSALPISHVYAFFHALRPALIVDKANLPSPAESIFNLHRHSDWSGKNMATYLPGRQYVERQQTIQLPYRGVYTIGLDQIELSDTLKLFKVSPRIRPHELRVYPRILPLSNLDFSLAQQSGPVNVESFGFLPDYSLFNQLREYRTGESTRHLAWKKFASTGIPVTKDYDSTTQSTVTIYVDLRPVSPKTDDVRETEDVTIEALVAMVNHFLELNLPVTVRAAGSDIYEFKGSHNSDFNRFYESTFNLLFVGKISPSQLYQTPRQTTEHVEENSIFIITHRPDSEMVILMEEQRYSHLSSTLVYNQTAGADESEYPAIEYLKEHDVRVLILRGSESIVPDLEENNEKF